MKTLAIALALSSTPALSGTLTIAFVELDRGAIVSPYYPEMPEDLLTQGGADSDPFFVFDVPTLRRKTDFFFSAILDGDDPIIAVQNPFNATLVRMGGHLNHTNFNGYPFGSFQIGFQGGITMIYGELYDGGDHIADLWPEGVSVDHNQGDYNTYSTGYWKATYRWSPAHVPVPASLPMLLFGTTALAAFKLRKRR